MRSISLCHAVEDETFANELAGFLELNLLLSEPCDHTVIGPELDLIEATGRALSAEAAIVLLSSASVPRVLDRKTWERAFIEEPKELLTPIGFVLVRECSFPQLLRRERFFDASRDQLNAMREIKRWLLRPNESSRSTVAVSAELEAIRRTVADCPGIVVEVDADHAVRFAEECGADFEGVYRLDCRGLSRAGIRGEIASATGLSVPETMERRLLIVLAGIEAADRDTIPSGGRLSVILTAPFAGPLRGAVSNAASDAVRQFQHDPANALGWKAVSLLKQQGRLLEVMELLTAMFHIAALDGDQLAQSRVEREQFWIREELDFEGPSAAPPHDPSIGGQLSFAF